MNQMIDRLAARGFTPDENNVWRRTDDVYETIAEFGVDDNAPEGWKFSIANFEDFEEDEQDRAWLDAPVFWVTEDGEFIAADGIDENTARILYPEAFNLTTCCRAERTYVEGVLSCKNCYEAVPA